MTALSKSQYSPVFTFRFLSIRTQKYILRSQCPTTTPRQFLWVSFKNESYNTPLSKGKGLCTQWPIGVCGHQAQQLSLVLARVPKQHCQVPFLKDTAVTSPNSLNQSFPKWKMGYLETFQRLRRGCQRREPQHQSRGLLPGWQECFLFSTPNLLGTINTLPYFPGERTTSVRLCSFHPWRANTSEDNCYSFRNGGWSQLEKGSTQLSHSTVPPRDCLFPYKWFCL